MVAADHTFRVSYEQGFLNGGYFPVERALELLTYEADREILKTRWKSIKITARRLRNRLRPHFAGGVAFDEKCNMFMTKRRRA